MSVNASGESAEFAEAKIAEAHARSSTYPDQGSGGQAARRTAATRRERADLLARARILWVDDHPETNTPITDLLRRYGAVVDTAWSNANAEALIRSSRYGVVISDVARARLVLRTLPRNRDKQSISVGLEPIPHRAFDHAVSAPLADQGDPLCILSASSLVPQ